MGADITATYKGKDDTTLRQSTINPLPPLRLRRLELHSLKARYRVSLRVTMEKIGGGVLRVRVTSSFLSIILRHLILLCTENLTESPRAGTGHRSHSDELGGDHHDTLNSRSISDETYHTPTMTSSSGRKLARSPSAGRDYHHQPQAQHTSHIHGGREQFYTPAIQPDRTLASEPRHGSSRKCHCGGDRSSLMLFCAQIREYYPTDL
jgi:hypothetical protein